MMKAIAICGSPREGGNTEYYLKTVLGELAQKGVETEYIPMLDKTVKPCRGCYGCLQAKKCVQDDDFEAIFEKMEQADIIIWARRCMSANPLRCCKRCWSGSRFRRALPAGC